MALSNLALVPRADQMPAEIPAGGMFNIRGCTFTPTGMIIERGLPIENWIEAGRALKRAGDAFQLCVGDWIRFGKREYTKKKYEEAIALTGYKEGTLRDNVWVANKIPLSARADNLTFRHYRVVASLPSPRAIKKWITRASKGKGGKRWTASRLKQEIQNASRPRKPEAFTVELQRLHDTVVR